MVANAGQSGRSIHDFVRQPPTGWGRDRSLVPGGPKCDWVVSQSDGSDFALRGRQVIDMAEEYS